MPRTPNEYVVHLLIEGGHREEVRFTTIQDFQKWYSSEFLPKSTSDDFISVPIKNIQGSTWLSVHHELWQFGWSRYLALVWNGFSG